MSRELDMKVAEALGHVDRPCSFDVNEDITQFKDATWQCDICGYTGEAGKKWHWTDFSHNVDIPHYRTSIAAAWELYKEADKAGLRMVIENEGDGTHSVDLYRNVCECGCSEEVAWVLVRLVDEIPEAICKAFLAWKDGDDEKH